MCESVSGDMSATWFKGQYCIYYYNIISYLDLFGQTRVPRKPPDAEDPSAQSGRPQGIEARKEASLDG